MKAKRSIRTVKNRKFRAYRNYWDWLRMKGSQECLYWNMKDLPNLDVAMKLTKGRTAAVQAGGNLGIFPKRMAEEFETVYTFEPDARLFGYMKHNAPEKNIVAMQAAIGNSREPVKMDCRRRDGSNRNVHEGLTFIAGPGVIPQMLVDDLKLAACDLIYLDIEGYELNALRGAEETIKKYKPVIALEINGNIAHYNATKEEIRSWIEVHGYTKVVRQNGDDIYVAS